MLLVVVTVVSGGAVVVVVGVDFGGVSEFHARGGKYSFSSSSVAGAVDVSLLQQ